jgi:molybdenum cofactor cytidylyltransferase
VKFGPVPLERALGRILGHNVAGPDGKRLLRKGRPLSDADLEALRVLGRTVVYVAEPDPGDVGEDEAARRVAQAASGAGIEAGSAASGRVNLLARERGVLRVEGSHLSELNLSEGLTIATLPAHSTVSARQIVATVKVIPYAVPEETLRRMEQRARETGAPVRLDPLRPRRVGLILSGSPSARERVRRDFEGPLASRVESLGSSVAATDFVPLEEQAGEAALAATLRRQAEAGMELLILAGETAIVDRDDIAPRAVERAGGEIAAFGAPVDPGNLLLVAYLGGVPILGAPGCARSRRANVVDWVLPRLLVGERLERGDVAALGAGGLLEDVPERPMPRAHRAGTPAD